jgi:hypothetical protein
MENKEKLNVNGKDPNVGTEFSSGEWGILKAGATSLHQMLPIMFVSKAQDRTHCLQSSGLKPGTYRFN